MADDDLNGNLFSSQRGMLLVVALVVYLLINVAFAFGGKVPESSLTTLGALLILGFGFFYKDKAAEKTAAEATKKIEATNAGTVSTLVSGPYSSSTGERTGL